MRELSLFSGAGGGLLATKHLLGWETVGYVEIEEYCQKVITQRIKDGYLDNAPIFTDIKTFIDTGCCELYKGITDVITAGFPCQPFSVAGKQAAENDPRNMWPSTRDCISIIRPKYVFLENVPGLLSLPYIWTIFGDLAKAGYNVRWICLGADDCGAPHHRKRLWLLAYTKQSGGWTHRRFNNQRGDSSEIRREGIQPKNRETYPNNFRESCKNMANSYNGRLQEGCDSARWKEGTIINRSSEWTGMANPKGKTRKRETPRGTWYRDPANGPIKSRLGRVAHGVANRVDRLKATGNGQVSIVAATAWETLNSSGFLTS